MHKIKAFKVRGEGYGEVSQLAIKRDWMDETWKAHAYHCFPVSLTNQLGWGISFPEDIVFIWDGISDSTQDHVKILKGEKYAYSGRGNATVSFNTGLRFITDPEITLLQMPVPNYLRHGVQPFTTLISTSFFQGELPVAWRVTEPNKEITIKANTPVISILPIDLSSLQNSEIIFEDLSLMPQSMQNPEEYGNIVYEINRSGKWTDFYRNGVDHKGNKVGTHQVKSIKLNVK